LLFLCHKKRLNYKNITQGFLRCFRDPIRIPGIRENYHRVPRTRENGAPRIREIGSLQVHTRYLTLSFKALITGNFIRNLGVFLGLVLELIPDASLTLLVCEIPLFVAEWCHSLHTDAWVAFCSNKKVVSHSLLYVRPESYEPCDFLGVVVTLLSQRRRPVCKRWACLVLETHYTVHALPVITQKNYFESRIPQILPTSGTWASM